MAVIAFYTNPDRPEASALAERAAGWLVQQGHRAVSALRPDGTVAVDGADLLVSLGGDGTLLRSVEAALAGRIPVLGVNLGRLGYLTPVEPAGLEDALASFLSGTHQVDERMTLSVTVHRADGTSLATRHALNEAVVEKTVPGHTVRMTTSIDERPFVTYAADGVLVATPTGSTAYNLSAHGPVLSPQLRAIVVTPLAPHMLFDRPLVLDPGQLLRLAVEQPRPAVLVVDGLTVASLEPGDAVVYREGPRPARLVSFRSTDFHTILRSKFGLADR
jgi:NAD+ kinase